MEKTFQSIKFNTCSIRGEVTSTLEQCQGWVWGAGQIPKTEPEVLTILAQVQLGQAPAIKGLLKDGTGVTVTHGVQVHGFILHPGLQQQRDRKGKKEGGGGERENKL